MMHYQVKSNWHLRQNHTKSDFSNFLVADCVFSPLFLSELHEKMKMNPKYSNPTLPRNRDICADPLLRFRSKNP